MENILYVGIGGFFGAGCRYAAGTAFASHIDFPAVTFAINIAGSFLIGIISVTASHFSMSGHPAAALLQAGFCGGFTTFSTFSLETYTLIEKGRYELAAAYAAASVVSCIASVAAGRSMMLRVFG